jgi:hypothetical protein
LLLFRRRKFSQIRPVTKETVSLAGSSPQAAIAAPIPHTHRPTLPNISLDQSDRKN